MDKAVNEDSMDRHRHVAAERAQLHHRLLRARELCLLGEYDTGVPEFCAVIQEVRRHCASAPSEVRQVLQDLQNEYVVYVQYQKTLHDLRASSEHVQERRRRRVQPRAAWDTMDTHPVSRKRPQSSGSHDGTEPMDIDQGGRMPSRSTTRSGALDLDKRLPAWARQPEPARKVQSTTSTKRSLSSAKVSRGGPGKDKENQSKNIVARYGTSYKSTAEMSLTQRRPRTSIGRRQSTDSDQSKPTTSTTPSDEADLISGRKKYSDVAKESGWADQELIESIEREIVDRGERITFDHIAGLAHTKQLLQEAVMLPQIAPHLFKDGLLKPCSGILMFGPPGTGKTLLAKAVANECGLTFFNVSASTLSSKYRGDSEKLVRILFEMARYYAPSIIFMDEIDAVASARGGANEHEASRRVKTELLVQINGVSSGEDDSAHVMLLAATNLPWELDEAMRRRLTKRVYIALPEDDARRALFQLNLRKVQLAADVDVEELVAKTKGYSGDDITNVCETAKRMPVKRLYTPDVLSQLTRRMADTTAVGGVTPSELQHQELIVTKNDFVEALGNVSKSVGHEQLRRYSEWEREFGSK